LVRIVTAKKVIKLSGNEYQITNKNQSQDIAIRKITFFGTEVKECDDALIAKIEEYKTGWETFGKSWMMDYWDGRIRIGYEDVQEGSFNPLTWSHKEYKSLFIVDCYENNGVWEVRETKTLLGIPSEKSKEEITEELNRFLKTKVGSEWLERQKALYCL
jgi:hypothetical protein